MNESNAESENQEPVEEQVQELPILSGEKTQEGPNPLHVKIQTYDGPLDLLLDLIKKSEMDIYDIEISEITKQYLDHLATMKALDLDIAGEFLVLAATLLYIKSKMLLPQQKEEDEEMDGEDPRAELVQKLVEYQAFKKAASELGLLESERGQTYTRQISDYYLSELDPEDSEIDSFSANLYDLLSAFQKVLSKSSREDMHEVFEEVVTIEQKMEEMKFVLARQGKVKFFDLFQDRWTKNELIATFLALLEIVRVRYARIVQDQQYADILIQKIKEENA